MPERVQLSRKKGWRKPEGAIVVARPSKWGNPFKVGGTYSGFTTVTVESVKIEDRAHAVEYFRRWIDNTFAGLAIEEDARAELSGHDLACWCPLDQPCHADVLLEIANADTPPDA